MRTRIQKQIVRHNVLSAECYEELYLDLPKLIKLEKPDGKIDSVK